MARKTKQYADTPISDTDLTDSGNVAEALRHDIAVAAYYRALARGFAPGCEMQDWLTAEQEIMAVKQAA